MNRWLHTQSRELALAKLKEGYTLVEHFMLKCPRMGGGEPRTLFILKEMKT